MDIKPIKTEADYEAALKGIEYLFDVEPGTTERNRLEILTTLVEAYEDEHYDIPAPGLVNAILYFVESRKITQIWNHTNETDF